MMPLIASLASAVTAKDDRDLIRHDDRHEVILRGQGKRG